jgi:hypothetical protein
MILAMAGVASAANIIVGDQPSGQIHLYDETTGAYNGLLVDVTVQGYTNPKELSVGSDGVLVVNVDQGIARYNALDGTPLGLWMSTRHSTMTQDTATNVVYTGSPGAPYNIYQLVGGVESVFHTLSTPTPTGRVDHSIMALNMGVKAPKVMAYSDVSSWNVVQSAPLPGGADFTDWIYLQNVAASGLQETLTNAYYNGSNQMRSCNMTMYSWPHYDDGSLQGVLIDGTSVINGEINLSPNDGIVYYAEQDEVRYVTGNTPGAFATRVLDPAHLTDVFGLAWQPIPEPMTLSLLAIGGLALIRRKR